MCEAADLASVMVAPSAAATGPPDSEWLFADTALANFGEKVPDAIMGKPRWVFDAVYTPRDTEFIIEAGKRGAEVISGYELFFHQGVDAFRLFTGLSVDEAALRAALEQPDG